jgi:prepilin-type N-terminal cleavage/methylation domain-containing protein/prepilin-type processing-associated H-X9-DG protein
MDIARSISSEDYMILCRRAFTLIELLVTIAVIGILLGISLPAVQAMRGAAQRTACANNLRQIALAVNNYETAFQSFPMGCHAFDDANWPSRTWLAEILPYIEEHSLYDQSILLYRAGISPFNHGAQLHPVKTFGCPSDGRSGTPQWTHGPRLVALTSYVGVFGTDRTAPTGVFIHNESIHPHQVRDGLSATLMIGERPGSPDNWYGWWYAGVGQDYSGNPDMIMGVRETNLQVQYAEGCPVGPYHFEKGHFDRMQDLFHFWSPHAGGANFAFCDSSIKFLPYETDSILVELATRDGHEVVNGF